MNKLVVIAIGGNSLIEKGESVTVNSQYLAIKKTCSHIASLIKKGWRVLLIHGNGPQVGYILRRVEIASNELHTVPLDSCVADTQGAIGYQIQNALRNEFLKSNLDKEVVTIITQVVVDPLDPSFLKPSKPIGSFMSKEIADEHVEKGGWVVVEDSGRGWRRVVPSPKPLEIIEKRCVKELLDLGFVVVAGGGGGVPVIKKIDGTYEGKEAVIDKDLVASLFAIELKADAFIISTAVDKVSIHFGKENQKELNTITLKEAREYEEMGEFPPGSMLPKIKAMTSYVEKVGGIGIITSPENILKALEEGIEGTRIIR